MIDALFNQPDYLAAKKALDAVALRQQAIASNIANLETPGYKRMDVAASFSTELPRDPQEIAALKPQLEVDSNAVPVSPDGNTVSLEDELFKMNQNSLANTLETQLISTDFYRLKMAITGTAT